MALNLGKLADRGRDQLPDIGDALRLAPLKRGNLGEGPHQRAAPIDVVDQQRCRVNDIAIPLAVGPHLPRFRQRQPLRDHARSGDAHAERGIQLVSDAGNHAGNRAMTLHLPAGLGQTALDVFLMAGNGRLAHPPAEGRQQPRQQRLMLKQ